MKEWRSAPRLVFFFHFRRLIILVSAGINSMTISFFFFCQFLVWNDVYIIPCVYVFFFFLVILYLARVAWSFLSIRSGPSGLFYFYFYFYFLLLFILFYSLLFLLCYKKKKKTKERKNKFPIAFFCVLLLARPSTGWWPSSQMSLLSVSPLRRNHTSLSVLACPQRFLADLSIWLPCGSKNLFTIHNE